MNLMKIELGQKIIIEGLIEMKVIWWIMRMKKKRKKEEKFKKLRIMEKVLRREEVKQKRKWWMKIMSMIIEGMVIMEIDQKIWKKRKIEMKGKEKIEIVIDNGWD